MLSAAIDPTGLTYIALVYWVPAAITVIFGGYLAAIILPVLQRSSQRAQRNIDRKTQLSEDVVTSFSGYILSWRRLRQISELELARPLTKDEQDRKAEFVVARNQHRDSLMDSLRLCCLYFISETSSEILRFISWDEGQAALEIHNLAPLDDWRGWEVRIVEMLKTELR